MIVGTLLVPVVRHRTDVAASALPADASAAAHLQQPSRRCCTMRITTLLLTLAAIGVVLVISANWNARGEEVKRHKLHVDVKKSAGAAKTPYAAWAVGEELHNVATETALPASAAVAPFGTSLPADAAASAVARPAPQPKAPIPCAPGCEKNGVCNSDLGRCDCPPFIGGEACDKPLFPACAAMPGLTEVAPAPCVYDQHTMNVPTSCECLMGCESLGLMGVRECYVVDPSNRTVADWVKQQIHMRGLTPNMEFYDAHLKLAHKESVANCGGKGVWAPRMPPTGAGPMGAPKRCYCYASYRGDQCQFDTRPRAKGMCINGCSGRGECVRNWCHCQPGFYGTDCSLGKPRDGGADAPALPPPIGAQRDAKAPRVYIYDLPPRFNGWMHAGDAGWWQDMDLWGEDVIIHRRALRSYYRVDDPELADYFLVPVWDSSAMWQMNWGFRDLLPTGVRAHREAYEYIRKTWPYFDKKGGADHLWVFGHDQGGWRIRQKLPEIAKGIFISPFGGGPAQRGGHINGQDIVCPSVVQSTVLGLMNHAGRRRKEPQNFAFFQGKLNLHIPYEYSFGIRQCETRALEDAYARAHTLAQVLTAPDPPRRVLPTQGALQGAPQHAAHRCQGGARGRSRGLLPEHVRLEILRGRRRLWLLDARVRGVRGRLHPAHYAGRHPAGLRGAAAVVPLLAAPQQLPRADLQPRQDPRGHPGLDGEGDARQALLCVAALPVAAPRRRVDAAAGRRAPAQLRRLRVDCVDAAQAAAQ